MYFSAGEIDRHIDFLPAAVCLQPNGELVSDSDSTCPWGCVRTGYALGTCVQYRMCVSAARKLYHYIPVSPFKHRVNHADGSFIVNMNFIRQSRRKLSVLVVDDDTVAGVSC